MDVLVEFAAEAIEAWQYWVGDPAWPIVLVPLMWQLPGGLMIWVCLRTLHEPGR